MPRRGIAVLALVLALVLPLALQAQQVKHIILFIGDGMQLEAEIGASRYLFGEDFALSFHKLPYQGVVATWDVTTYNKHAQAERKPAYDPSAIVPSLGYDPLRGGLLPFPLQSSGFDSAYLLAAATDSASAATAWATGYKTDDGNISWLPGDPPNGALPTIAEILRRERGFSIGVASTVPFSHATPAAHVSHNTSRENYHAISEEIVLRTQPDVVIGGGYHSSTYVSETAYKYLTANAGSPYVFVERAAGVDGARSLAGAAALAVSQGKKLFGLYGDPARGNFESPAPRNSPGNPQIERGSIENPLLKDVVASALQVLGRNKRGFFVMFEQGDIDWAAHANDYQRIVGTVWDLHEAVLAAQAFVDRPGDDIDWSNTLLIVTADHANSFLRLEKQLGKGQLPEQHGKQYPNGEVSFRSGSHTNELVRLYARGAEVEKFRKLEGAWYPCTRIIDNTQLFHLMAEVAGAPQRAALHALPDQAACKAAAAVSH